MYDVNSGGVQPCDTFLSTPERVAPISISGRYLPARMSGSPHARPSIVRPGPRPRPAAAPAGPRLRRARPGDPGGGHRTVPAPVRPRVRPRRSRKPGKSPVDIDPVRCVYTIKRLNARKPKRPLVPCQRLLDVTYMYTLAFSPKLLRR